MEEAYKTCQYGNMFYKIKSEVDKIPDFRVTGRCRYPLNQILTIAFLATIAGRRGWKEFHEFGKTHEQYLRKLIDNFKGVPSADTFGRVFALLNPESLNQLLLKLGPFFERFNKDNGPGRRAWHESPSIIALDGKTCRGATAPGESKSKVHIVNAVSGNMIALGAKNVGEKSNEITAMPALIDELSDAGSIKKGIVITADAMGTQIKIVILIRANLADYLLCLKHNQENLATQVESIFNEGLNNYPDDFQWASTRLDPETGIPFMPHPLDDFTQISERELDKGHGRVEERHADVIYLNGPTGSVRKKLLKDWHDEAKCRAADDWIPNAKDWKDINSVVKIHRVTTKSDGKTTEETRYFISSLTLPPKQMLDLTVKHWSVETEHYHLDKSLGEDQSRIWKGHAAENLSTVRKIGLNFIIPQIQRHEDVTVKSIMDMAFRKWDYLLALISKRPGEVGSLSSWYGKE